ASKVLYLHPDHLNTPRLATDSAQTLLWSWNSDAYGVGAPNEDVDGDGNTTSIALRFPGQVYDATSQLSYNYYRDYNAQTGRYVQSDPIGLNGGINTYGYVGGNPLSYQDPSGLYGLTASGMLVEGAGVGGFISSGALVVPLALTGDTPNRNNFSYATYTRTNPGTGQVYCGRTSGYGTPEDLVRTRGMQQNHLNAEGFFPPVLDRFTNDYQAIRGREQQLIDFYGGAQSVGGSARNLINGVSDFNPRGILYDSAAKSSFGALPDNSPARIRIFGGR
ncbi:RHS repeat-associated core domain-containing protein, partial [Pseudomonas sp. dw_358]|uniref:RHS repeat-associated core domain-containing protein n=1 Tax=Pseudomonas sp. dw_358 TaxID=2720083 RepID=UPI001BD38D5B